MAPVDHRLPPAAPEQQERDRLHPLGLDQRQAFKHLIQRAKAAGKDAHRRRAHQEMHLANGKVVKVERQVRRDILVRRLLMRQNDVEPNRLAPRLGRTTIARLHHTGATAGDDHVLLAVRLHAAFGHQPRKPPRLVVIARQLGQHRGLGAVPMFRRRNPCAAKQHNRGFDPALIHHQLRLQKLQLQPHRAQLFAGHEIGVGKGQTIGRGTGLRGVGDPMRRLNILSAVTERMGARFVFHQTEP